MTPADNRITILVDDQAEDELTAEHGFALWVESEGRRILFDTGQGGALENNARVLGLDLGQLEILVVSHGHYDHTGGIRPVVQRARSINIYCHSGVFNPRYHMRNGTLRPVQMPQESMAAIHSVPFDRLHWVPRPIMLAEKIGTTGPIPRETSYEDTGGLFYLDPKGKRPDPIEDDLALWIRTDDGVIVCVGCCHAGLVNTLNYVRRLSRCQRVRAVIGGFHLLHADRERLDHTIAALQLIEPDLVVPCHCTGESAVASLRSALGDRVSPGVAGKTFRF